MKANNNGCKWGTKALIAFICTMQAASGFVLMGPANTGGAEAAGAQFNYTDEFNAVPKDINFRGGKRFFRWNTPDLVYSFDSSFINYFGQEGMDAIDEAITVINDFYVNEDYEGVTSLDLAKHGFSGNHNTSWINTTAQNAQIIDIKSLVLGMLVKQMGLGNPHRWAYSITSTRTNTVGSQITFETRLRNYDPITHQSSDLINGVKYSFRLIHDDPNPAVGALALPTTVDMEEFTTDTSGNAWTSLASITDAFYGNTAFWWTDVPSLFGFGVYYDGMNAMGGQYRPRHALTYDDAGGLKYLYATNNFAYEDLAPAVMLIEPAQFLPDHIAVNYPPVSGRRLPVFPRRANPTVTAPVPTFTTTFNNLPGVTGSGVPVGMVGTALRGGIDKMQFHYRPYDSLFAQVFTPTNFVWSDTFVGEDPVPDTIMISDSKGNDVGVINNKRRGIQWQTPNADPNDLHFWQRPYADMRFLTQKVGRNVTQPDLVFLAQDLGDSADGVPIGWQSPTLTYRDFTGINIGDTNAVDGITPVGPGVIDGFADNQIILNSGFSLDNTYEVIWSGEPSITGNQVGVPSLWGWVKGPGPNDLVTFPDLSNQAIFENNVMPDLSPPVITMVSDNGGASAIEANTLTRTEETLTIIGNEMASTTAIEILIGDLVVQTIMPADPYVVSNQRLDIPPGVISDLAEGTACTVRVWNSIGASEVGPEIFNIETGRPVIGGTNYDNIVLNREESVTIHGYGFKSKTATEAKLAFFRVDDSEGGAVQDNGLVASGISDGLPVAATFDVVSDTLAVLPLNSISAIADGANRRLRVARKTVASAVNVGYALSPSTNDMFTYITAKPVVSSLAQLESSSSWTDVTSNGAFRRDLALEVNGTALNTASVLEVVREDGTSFADPVFIQLPNPGVSVEDNGTRILMSANSIPYSDADINNATSVKRGLRIYNAVGNTDLNASQMFTVNTQPIFDGISGFNVGGYFNRDKTFGDDIAVYGSGLKVVDQIVFSDDNDTAQSRVTINLPSPGVTVTDTQIVVDTQVYQIGENADTDVNSSRRILKLVSTRDDAIMPIEQRFYVGTPPAFTSLSGLTAGNYTRDAMTLGFTGTGLGHVTQLEIVDSFGNSIAGVPGIFSGSDGTGGTGLTILSGTSLSVDANATGWLTTAHLLDSTPLESRRVKVTTPFGSATSNSASAFTVSATPALMASTQATFAGGGYTGDDISDPTDTGGTYDKSDGDLIINGTNFRGVTTVTFDSAGAAASGAYTLDPANPPAGFTFSADGTKITIGASSIPAGWIGLSDAIITLQSVAGGSITSGQIQTQE